MDSQNKEIGNRIYDLRISRGWTREVLAEKADISVQFLSDIEKGKKGMTVTTLRKLCNGLSVTADFLLEGENSDDGEEFAAILKSLPDSKRRYAKDLLLTFIQSHNEE